ADVAEEMFRSQRDRLELDVIETLSTLLLEEWGVDPSRRQQVSEMVRMHVLLTTPPDGDHRVRTFDHPEFRDWFTAYALREQVTGLAANEGGTQLGELLSAAQMTDATAKYVCALIDRDPLFVRAAIGRLSSLVEREWRPTYLQSNVGTLVPFLIDGVNFEER